MGSALGELPAFLISKYNSNKDQLLKIIENNNCSHFLNYIEKHKFKSILFAAAWPNFAFDACGLMCGYYDLVSMIL